MATRPATAPEIAPSTLGFPFATHSASIQARRRAGGGDLRNGHRHAGTAVGGDRGAGVEAEPADPQQGGADHGVAEVVRRHVVVPVADPLAEHERAHQPGDAGVDVNDGAAREVRGTQGAHPASRAPHPVCDRAVDQQRPQHHEHAHGGKLHAVGEGAGDQRRGDDGEGHLEHHVDRLGDGLRLGVVASPGRA